MDGASFEVKSGARVFCERELPELVRHFGEENRYARRESLVSDNNKWYIQNHFIKEVKQEVVINFIRDCIPIANKMLKEKEKEASSVSESWKK